jgi:purine-binding chemotaxis protein CheW
VRRYALRLAEIAGLFPDRKIIPLPGGPPALLGIAGFRGAILPVYDLPALLGLSLEPAPRWLAMAAGAPVAFAFTALDGLLRVGRDAIVVAHVADALPRPHVQLFLRASEQVRPIVDLASLLDAVGPRPGEP